MVEESGNGELTDPRPVPKRVMLPLQPDEGNCWVGANGLVLGVIRTTKIIGRRKKVEVGGGGAEEAVTRVLPGGKDPLSNFPWSICFLINSEVQVHEPGTLHLNITYRRSKEC